MSTELVIALAAIWFVVGWLPSRIVKHHFMYGASSGGWDWRDEWRLGVLPAIIGPLGALTLIICLMQMKQGFVIEGDRYEPAPWGFRW